MTGGPPTSPYATRLPDLGLTAEEKRTLALVLVGCAVAFALDECGRRIERRFVRRHPLTAEIAEGTAHHPPHRR